MISTINFQKKNLKMADGTELHAGLWPVMGASKGTVVLSHGYGEHIRRYDHVAAALNGRGYAVYGVDHRGHGESSKGGPTAYYDHLPQVVDDLARVVDWAASEQAGKPLFLLGHSMGGLFSLSYTIRESAAGRLKLQGVVQSATLFTQSSEIPPLQAAIIRLISRVAPRMAAVDRVPAEALSRAAEVGEAYERDPLVYHGKVAARVAVEAVNGADAAAAKLGVVTGPILILHGGADRIAKPVYSQQIYAGVASPDKALKMYEGAFHEILNETNRQEVLDDIGIWLDRHSG